MCQHLPNNRSGRLANFVIFWQTLNREVCFTGNFKSAIQSGTNEKVAGPAQVLPGLSGRYCS